MPYTFLVKVTLAELSRVAGLHWMIETCFGTTKGRLGHGHSEALCWDGWYCHMALCMPGLALFARQRATLVCVVNWRIERTEAKR